MAARGARFSLTAVVLFGAFAASAEAAPPWSAPASASTQPGASLGSPDVAFGADGSGLLSWTFNSDPLHPLSTRYSTALRGIAAGGALGAVREENVSLAARPVVFGRDRVALLREQATCGDPYGCNDTVGLHARLTLTLGRTSGTLGRPHEVARYVRAGDPALAGDARGRLLVTYTLRGRVEARMRTSGRRLGAPQALGSSERLVSLAAVVAPAGRALVAMQRSTPIRAPGIPPAIMRVQTALRPAGASRFRATQTLARARIPGGTQPPVLAAASADGTMTVAWNTVAPGGTGAVQVARSSATRIAAPRLLDGFAGLGDLDVRADGAGLVTGRGRLIAIRPGRLSTRSADVRPSSGSRSLPVARGRSASRRAPAEARAIAADPRARRPARTVPPASARRAAGLR